MPPSLPCLSSWNQGLRAVRFPQWTKNILVFVPVLLAHKFTKDSCLQAALIAFVSFSLCSSSGYIFNDILDRETDRHHFKKKDRPFAAGTLHVSTGLILMGVLLGGSFVIAVTWLSLSFVILLSLYAVSSVLYSSLLKRLAIIDVLVLAGLYLVRILAGGVAVDIPVSPWLLVFSGFLFLSLAFVKRYAELEAMPTSNPMSVSRRWYVQQHKELLLILGTSSGSLTVLVFALYVNNSQEIPVLYQQPEVLWGIGPCLLYWISRVWFLAYRGVMDQDPFLFTLNDPPSYVVGAVIAGLLLVAV